MTIKFAIEVEADALLKNRKFQEGWKRLYAICPWATPFQSVEYVSNWYDIYRECYQPVIVSQVSSDEKLTGLLTLAISSDSKELVAAGAHQAEYQVWLADPQDGNSFIENALQKIREYFPDHVIIFRYLPPSTPTDWTDSDQLWGKYCQLEKLRCPIMGLTDSEKLTAHLRHRDMKKSLNRLKRLGDVRLEPIKETTEFIAVFDELAIFYDFRQAAINGVFPFQEDPCKKPFHLALMNVPDLLYVMTLKLNERVIATHLGLPFRKRLFAILTSFNPFYARYSPSSVIRVLLGPELAKQGFSAWDLTPGGDRWKERFTTDYEEVSILTVFPDWRTLKHKEAGQKLSMLVKQTLQKLKIDPRVLKKHCIALHPLTLPHQLLQLVQRFWYRAALRMYVITAEEAAKLEYSQTMSKDCLEDVLKFQPTKSWYPHQYFLSQALRRIEKGNHIYTYVEQGQLLLYGWSVEQPNKVFFPEVEQELNFSSGSALLFDFYTHPALREREHEVFRNFLQTMLSDTMASGDIKQIYITVPMNNQHLRQAIEDLGLTYNYSLFKEIRFGKKRQWTNNPEGESQEHGNKRS
jgi:CelD/BcsL family acetyltransferase involved in cellulose biosynthesis